MFFYASLAFLLYLAGWLTWKWSLCSPRQSWHCSWLSKQLLAGPAILVMPRWMREPHSEFRIEVGKAAEHISSQKNKTCGPKELGSLCFLPCPMKSWGVAEPGALVWECLTGREGSEVCEGCGSLRQEIGNVAHSVSCQTAKQIFWFLTFHMDPLFSSIKLKTL